VVVVVATAVLGVGGTALALGQPSRPTLDLTSAPVVADPAPTTTPTPAVPAVKPKAAAGLGGHGVTSFVLGRTTQSVTYDRGTVEGLTYGAITVAHPDGSTATLSITSATKFRPLGRRPRLGQRVIVYSLGGPALVVVGR
jgi:hypothetical protein